MLLPAISPIMASANADVVSASGQCAALRSVVLLHVGDRARELLFSGRNMIADGWLDPGIANDGFKTIQRAAMHFDFSYEAVAMGGRANTESCYALALQFGQGVDSYVGTVLASGEVPR